MPCTPEVDALVADYFGQGWHVKDLRTRAVPRVMRGEVVTDHDILTPEEMARAPFYNELLRPHGYHWFAVAASGRALNTGGCRCSAGRGAARSRRRRCGRSPA